MSKTRRDMSWVQEGGSAQEIADRLRVWAMTIAPGVRVVYGERASAALAELCGHEEAARAIEGCEGVREALSVLWGHGYGEVK